MKNSRGGAKAQGNGSSAALKKKGAVSGKGAAQGGGRGSVRQRGRT